MAKLQEDTHTLVINGETVHVSNTGSISIDPIELLKSGKVKKDFAVLSEYLHDGDSAALQTDELEKNGI